MYSHRLSPFICFLLILLTGACSYMPPTNVCKEGQNCAPENAVDDRDIAKLYESRRWLPPGKLKIDTVELGKKSEIPVNDAQARLIGPSQEDAMRSLAAKIWMIENAQYTIDLAYYIFTPDLAGYAILGALCNAVKRGVDVRLVVDSLGSFSAGHNDLKGLDTCSTEAGYMRNLRGETTIYRARTQVVIFNAVSKPAVRFNRRSHDKLIIKDGHMPELAYVMTGGRNISVDYYGINDDGTQNEDTYKDIEILLRSGSSHDNLRHNIGSVSEIYHSLLFLHRGNKFLSAHNEREDRDDYESTYSILLDEQQRALQRLRELHENPEFARIYAGMDKYMQTGFLRVRARLAHELDNLSSVNVVTEREKNLRSNPNSIVGLLHALGKEAGGKLKTIKLVSPYFFIPRYYDEDGNVTFDGVEQMQDWLDEDPERTIELITNSVMTSDNFMAQAIIDMDTVPRILLSPELKAAWQKSLDKGELNPDIVQSEQWRRMINNPRIKIYQSGKLDSVMFKKGTKHYGKLHAKFILSNKHGFVGTTNLDYRSRLYNNEMGFFIQGDEFLSELDATFEDLKNDAYLWGSPEWLEMRRQLRALDTFKGKWSRKQHSVFTRLRRWGLEWQI
ncbi:MAG TPA: phospholipase [Gammaproteobacteria bacterium]|nr:phospholipase [Gammaproteobacteria bacterium]